MRKLLIAILSVSVFSPTLASAEEWKIGLVLCLTGACTGDGDAALKGAELAAEELNEQGGVLGRKVVFAVEDTAEALSGAAAITAYRKLRESPEISYFIGPTWTTGGLSLAPIAAKDQQIIMTSPSLAVKEFDEAGENLFNTYGTAESATRRIARLALENGWKKVAIWSSQHSWEVAQGDFFEDEIKKGGGEVVLKIEDLPGITVLDAQALKIASAKPDAVFFSVINQQAIAARALRRIGFNAPKLAVYVDETRLKESQGALEGTIFGRCGLPTKEFAEKLKRRYPSILSIEPPAGIAYDTVMMYARAVKEQNSFETAGAQAALLKMRFDGASGPFVFNPHGGAVREVKLKQIMNGAETDYSPPAK